MGLLVRTHSNANYPFDLTNFFDDFFTGVDATNLISNRHMPKQKSFVPNIDVTDTKDGLVVHADLPGIDEKDLEILVEDDQLIIKGQRQHEVKEETDKRWFFERSFGNFQRNISIPAEVNLDQVSAKFDKGVLTINLPKSAEAKQKVRKITVN